MDATPNRSKAQPRSLQEIKKVGPDLKEARQKLRKEWIPYWIGHTTEFRPTTKMPQFRSSQDDNPGHLRFHLAGFALRPSRSISKPAGNAAHGKESARIERGCLACHAIGEGANAVGGTFAANLSRVGEKENYDYLVRWVHNPRQRSASLLPVRKERSRPGRLRQAQSALRLRSRSLALPERRPRTRRSAADVMPSLRLSDRRFARHRQLPDDAEARRRDLRRSQLHGRSARWLRKAKTSSATSVAPDATKSAASKTKAASAPS